MPTIHDPSEALKLHAIESEGTLSVGDLILALTGLPPTLPVVLEGCDCFGEVAAVILGYAKGDEQCVLLQQRNWEDDLA